MIRTIIRQLLVNIISKFTKILEWFANRETKHVPRDVKSIEAAVTEIGKRGRIIIAAGTYRENINIPTGKRITIQSDGIESPKLFALNPELPVLHVSPKAELSLIGMSVYGTRCGILAGSRRTEEAANRVTLVHTHVADAEYGIYGLAKQFHIEHSIVEHNVYGLAMIGSVSLVNTIVVSNYANVLLSGDGKPPWDAAAYAVTGNKVLIKNVTICDCQKGGLSIWNVADATVKNVYVRKNGYIGVQLNSIKNFTFTDSNVGETHEWNGGWGDGLSVTNSVGLVKNNQFSANKRANIIYWDHSSGKIDSNLSIYAIFALHLEGGSNPEITATNYFFGNVENRVTFGKPLEPSPVPEIPTL